MNLKSVVIIPARYASTRLHAKCLIEVEGKPIIQYVWENAIKSNAQKVIIATDNEKIFDIAKSFNAEVEMTSSEHKSGSDRISEVIKRHPEFDIVINLQGDEPMMPYQGINSLISLLENKPEADIATLIRTLENEEDINDPNVVKCVKTKDDFALYFSRCPIPYPRNKEHAKYFGHIGIYAYRKNVLLEMSSLKQTDLELTESLEQLRALQNGYKIATEIINFAPIGIDTQEDVVKFANLIKS